MIDWSFDTFFHDISRLTFANDSPNDDILAADDIKIQLNDFSKTFSSKGFIQLFRSLQMEQIFCHTFDFISEMATYMRCGHYWFLMSHIKNREQIGGHQSSFLQQQHFIELLIVFFLNTYINISLSRWRHDTGDSFLLRNVFLGCASSAAGMRSLKSP